MLNRVDWSCDGLRAFGTREALAGRLTPAPPLPIPLWPLPRTRSLLDQAPSSAVRICVGATLSDALISDAVASGALRSPLIADGKGEKTAWAPAPMVRRESAEGDVWREASSSSGLSLPPSLRHRFAVVEDDSGSAGGGDGSRGEGEAAEKGGAAVGERRLFVLAQLMRAEVREWERLAESADRPPRPRCVVFARDEDSVLPVALSLRTALWGCHAVACLLPSTGQAPSLVASAFRRAANSDRGFEAVALGQSASVLVAPASAARGLDFANVSSVYALDIPPTAAEYVHLAGRAGRVGQEVQGVVTSVLASRSAVDALRAIVEGELGRELSPCGPAGLPQ